MTRRNDKRNNILNRQRNNKPELPTFSQMLFGIVGKCVDMIAKKMAEIAEEETPDIHAEGISNQDVTNINNGKSTLSKLRIPSDGSAVEYPIPDNLQFFFADDGKLMVRKKIEGDQNPTDEGEGEPNTYDDICNKLFFNKKVYFLSCKSIESEKAYVGSYNNIDNCASEAQARRLIAFNKLQNIAKYLNEGWKPDFKAGMYNWYIIKSRDGGYKAMFISSENEGIVYFKSQYIANKAIEIMGEDSLNDLFSTDW